MDYTMLGQRIRHYRQKLHLTQEQLAERAGVSASFLGHIERGSRAASLETVMQLCAALDVTPNDLLADEALLMGLDLPDLVTVSPKEIVTGVATLLRNRGKA